MASGAQTTTADLAPAIPKPSPVLRGQRVFSVDGVEAVFMGDSSYTSFALDAAATSSSETTGLGGSASSASIAPSLGSTAAAVAPGGAGSGAGSGAGPAAVAGSASDLLRSRIPVLQQSHKPSVFTSGRPPWYSKDGQVKEAFLIGCAGGSASGKTTVAEKIISELDVPWVVLLSMDSFYMPLTQEQKAAAYANKYNFDCPEAFDYPLLKETIKLIKSGHRVDIPVYDFSTHSRTAETITLYGADVVVFEGIFALHDDTINEMMDMKIFVDTDDDIRLARRLRRDIAERGRDFTGVIQQYNTFVKPAFNKYIRPCINKADVIVPRGGDNRVAIDLIARHIRRMLAKSGVKFRTELAAINKDAPLPDSVHLLPATKQIKALHTIVRNKECSRDDFIFYSQRLFRLLIEESLSMMPFEPFEIETPTGHAYQGTRTTSEISGVSIVRAGIALENALHDVCKDAKIGKILIQTDLRTGEPSLHYNHLPKSISKGHVLLMDGTIATGAAALMAIRVLKDHHVPEENIIFVAMLAAPQGIHAIAYAFPKVKIVVSEIDDGLNDLLHIVPGIGNFGDRFYGTD